MTSNLIKKPLPFLALFLAHLIWGANFVVAKITLTEVPVMSLSFIRFTLALILILPFLINFNQKDPKINKVKLKDVPKFLAVGVLMVTLHIALFYEGLLRTTAINASVLMLILPIMSVAAGWIILKEKIYLINLLGIFLGFLGSLVILGLPLIFVDGINPQNLAGNILIVICAISFLIGSIISVDLLKRYSAIFLTATMFLVGSLTFFFPALNEYYANPAWISQLSILGILGIVYITLLSSVCAYFLLIWGLSKTKLSQSTLFQYMEPAVAATLAVPFLGERISYSFIVGTIMVVLGVYWGTLGRLAHHHLHHRAHRG